MVIEKYASAISRSYWIMLGLCGAALVVSTGHDEAKPYKDAIIELHTLSARSMTADAVDEKVAKLTQNQIALPIAQTISNEAAKTGTKLDPQTLAPAIKYFLIDEGPQNIDLNGPPSTVISGIQTIMDAKPYILQVPKDTSGPEFESSIAAAFRKARNQQAPLIGAEFDCNWANDQCRSELTFGPSAAGENVTRVEFFVPSQKTVVQVYPYQVLGFPDIASARRALAVPRLREYQNELSGKSVDQAVAYLAEEASEKEGSIKVFDMTFSGSAIFIALPTGILVSLCWILMHLRELVSIKFDCDDIRKEAVELFYENLWTAYTVQAMIVIVPAGSLLLLSRAIPNGSSRLLVPLLMAATVMAFIASCCILVERARVMHAVRASQPITPEC